jgi:hypothetical protein
MLNDLKFALRQLRKSPGFTLTAVLTLALGIGANTAIFSLVESIMLRPLPFPQQDRLALISSPDESSFPKGWIRALGEHSESFSAVSGFGADAESNVATADTSERVFSAAVMANALDTLGVRPALGSFFTPNESIAGRDLVVVLSYGYWQQRFGQSPEVIGQTIPAHRRGVACRGALPLCGYAVCHPSGIQRRGSDRSLAGLRLACLRTPEGRGNPSAGTSGNAEIARRLITAFSLADAGYVGI